MGPCLRGGTVRVEAGDTVIERRSRTLMTVESAEPRLVRCIWFQRGVPVRCDFERAQLVPVRCGRAQWWVN